MRHLLNFVPTVKYRSGSSFMYKTILSLLYVVPTMMTGYMGYQYVNTSDVIARLNAASDVLEKHTSEFQKKLAESRPDLDEIDQINRRLVTYHHTNQTLRFSWNELYKTLETILPQGVRLTRVRIVPKKLIKIALAGNARELGDVTALLKSLYALDRFANPRLLRHAKLSAKDESGVTFDMDVDYLPLSGQEGTHP